MEKVLAYFVNRSLLVNLLFIFVVISGVVSLYSLQYNAFPSSDFGIVEINTPYPGAGPEQVELNVSIPLEEEVIKVAGVVKVVSKSMEGLSSLLIKLDSDNSRKVNDAVVADIQQALDRSIAQLPSELPGKPLLKRRRTDDIPLIQLVVFGEVPENILRKTAKIIEDELRVVRGVSGVSLSGYRDREIKILLDRTSLYQRRIAPFEIISAVHERNLRESGGSIESYTSEKNVLTLGQFDQPKDVGDVIIRSGEPGDFLRIRDVAKIIDGYKDREIETLVDGQSGISLFPTKKSNYDGIRTVKRINSYVAELSARLPAGVQVKLINDSTQTTQSHLNTLLSSALAGLLLVFMSLVLFFPFRVALWVSIGIPTAILMVFSLMSVLGLTINQISLGAIILILGIIVDDAIVTSESIIRQSEYGLAPKEAAIKGTYEVTAPVIAGSITTILAFLPAAFLGGDEGKVMWLLPVMAILLIGMSLIECKLMLPNHIAHALRVPVQRTKASRLFVKLEALYIRSLVKLLQYKYIVIVLIVIATILAAFIVISKLDFNLYPEANVESIVIKVEFADGTPFEKTRAELLEISKLTRGFIPADDLDNIVITVGHHDDNYLKVTDGRNRSWGMLEVALKPIAKRSSNSIDIVHKLQEVLSLDERLINVEVLGKKPTPDTGYPVEIDIIGGDDTLRKSTAKNIVHWLRNHKGVVKAWGSDRKGKDVIKLKLNHEAIKSYGLTVLSISEMVRLAFDGVIIDELQTIDENIEYRLKLDKTGQAGVGDLYSLYVLNKDGDPVALRSVVEFEQEPGDAEIKHYLGQRTSTVYAYIDRSVTSPVRINSEIKDYLSANNLDRPELRVHFGGEIEKQIDALENIGASLAYCLLGIFVVLVIIFNSISQPFLVMIVIPFSVVGVLVALAFHNIELGVTALVGIMGLAGVVINDSIVMVDRINRANIIGANKPVLQGYIDIAECAASRLRPVFVTTVTTALGLFPGAYGLYGKNPFLEPMMLTMLWGVCVGSLVTLFILPCLYGVNCDLKKAKLGINQQVKSEMS